MYPDALADFEHRLETNHGLADVPILAALPGLFAKAVHADPVYRERVMRLAVTCVCGHSSAYPANLEPHWERTWRVSVSTVLTLAAHEYPQVRRAAVFVLSDAVPMAAEVAAALRERFADEPEPLIRAAILQTIGSLARHLDDPAREGLREWLADLTGPRHGETGLAASLALRGLRV